MVKYNVLYWSFPSVHIPFCSALLELNSDVCEWGMKTKRTPSYLEANGVSVAQSVSAFGCKTKGWWLKPTQGRSHFPVNNLTTLS